MDMHNERRDFPCDRVCKHNEKGHCSLEWISVGLVDFFSNATVCESQESIEVQDYIGEEIDEECPECGATLLADKHGTKWCSECDWANEEDMREFIRSLEAQ